jgi:hypothetical protein
MSDVFITHATYKLKPRVGYFSLNCELIMTSSSTVVEQKDVGN